MKVFRSGLISFLLILLGWEVLVLVTGVPNFILPGPLRVAETLWTSRALLAEHALTTLIEIVLGIVIGVTFGAFTAFGFMVSRVMRERMQPVMVLSQAIPVFALAPLLTLWFGYGIWSKIVMTTLIIYFPVTVAFYDGLRRTDRNLLDLARIMGASPLRTLWLIRAPAALPALGSGLKLAAVYAPIGAVIGEWVGASHGLGYLMLLANGRAKTDLMFAAVIVLACLAVMLYFAIGALARRLARWQPDSA
ncbi:ABC transporter permease [Rhodobacteraceae bacterium NNCM2]|nr:ABC transporter permease [Coraliihabitans acroporae]